MQNTEVCLLARIKPSFSFKVKESGIEEIQGNIQIRPSAAADEF